jgi:hypothetical protein
MNSHDYPYSDSQFGGYDERVEFIENLHSDMPIRPQDIVVVNWMHVDAMPTSYQKVLVVNKLDDFYKKSARLVRVINDLRYSFMPHEFIYVINPNDIPNVSRVKIFGCGLCPICRQSLQGSFSSGYNCPHGFRKWTISEVLPPF